MIRINAIIKYPGSKWRIADWIISFFPDHHSYLEPFFGSGAVFFNKPRSHIETINDLDGDVVNLFEWVKKDPEHLAREIYYTPYARQVYEESFDRIHGNSLYKAVNFLIRSNMSYGHSANRGKEGWKKDIAGRERSYSSKDWTELPEKICKAAERLRGVQIECLPAIEVIQRYNHQNVLIYADPPYVLSTKAHKLYKKEMSDKEHAELLEILREHKGKILLSGYDSKLYRDMLQGWHREENYCYTQSGSRRKEVLWMNFGPEWRQLELLI